MQAILAGPGLPLGNTRGRLTGRINGAINNVKNWRDEYARDMTAESLIIETIFENEGPLAINDPLVLEAEHAGIKAGSFYAENARRLGALGGFAESARLITF
jgi:hypothetical protein